MITTYTLKTFFLNFLYFPFITLLLWLDLTVLSVQILAVLLMLDLLIGLAKSIRLGHDVSYSRFIAGFVGKFFILLIPVVIALAFKGAELNFASVAMVFVYAFIFAETISIITNILSYREKRAIAKPDIVNKIVAKSAKVSEKFLKIFD